MDGTYAPLASATPDNDAPLTIEGTPAWALDANAISLHPTSIPSFETLTVLALPWAWKAFAGAFLMWVLAPLLTFCACHKCTGDSGFVPIPWWLMPALYICVSCLLYLEHRTRACRLPYDVSTIPRKELLKLMGIQWNFNAWFMGTNIISYFTHLDIITSGVYMVRSIMSQICGSEGKASMESMWRWTVSHSAFSPVISVVPFSAYPTAAWSFMLLQFVFGLYHTWPLTNKNQQGTDLNYDIISAKSEIQQFQITHQEYQTCASRNTNFALVHQILCQTARMSSLKPFDDWYDMQNSTSENPDKRFQVPKAIGLKLRRSTQKMLFFDIFESMFKVNIQAAGLGLARAAATDGSLDGITLMSICISLALGMYNWIQALMRATQYKDAISSVDIMSDVSATVQANIGIDAWVTVMHEAFKDPLLKHEDLWSQVQPYVQSKIDEYVDDEGEKEVALHGSHGIFIQMLSAITMGVKQQRSLQSNYLKFVAVALLYLLLWLRAAYQTLMVMRCDTGLYNIGVGCIALPP